MSIGYMRIRRSATCSGASVRNSGMISTVLIAAAIAAQTRRYTVKRANRCAGVKRRQIRCATGSVVTALVATLVVFQVLFATDGAAFAAPEDIRERESIDEDRSNVGGEDFAGQDERDDRNQNRAHVVVVESLKGSEQRAADAAGADDADHGRIAQIGIELIGAEADKAGKDLREDTIGDHAHERRAGCADGFYLLQRDLLDRFRKQLGGKSHRRDRKRQNASQRSEAYCLDEEDRDDDGMKRARGDDDQPRRPACPCRHEISRRAKSDRQRQCDAESRSEHSDLQAFLEALEQ